jgi:hypothetical protein
VLLLTYGIFGGIIMTLRKIILFLASAVLVNCMNGVVLAEGCDDAIVKIKNDTARNLTVAYGPSNAGWKGMYHLSANATLQLPYTASDLSRFTQEQIVSMPTIKNDTNQKSVAIDINIEQQRKNGPEGAQILLSH